MFFILPVGMDYRARRYPVVTFTLMGICTAIYLVTLFSTLSDHTDGTRDWIHENLWLTPNKSYWWTYVTSIFVHAGFFHLAGNMVYLFLFGACVEDMIGRLRFTIFYLACGVGAALAYVALSPEHFASSIPMGGASGAISGCIGGYLMLRAKGKIEFKWVFVFWFFIVFRIWNGEFTLPAWLVITFWFLEDLAKMILNLLTDHQGGGVAFGAHVGGTLVGLGLIGVLKLLPQLALPEEDEEDEEEEGVTPSAATPRIHVTVTNTSAPAIAGPRTIHLSWGDSQSGPFSPSEIEQMFRSGEIPTEALYWQEGMEEWRTAEELREPGVA
jgi:membrane associated rhomboid family serine protease